MPRSRASSNKSQTLDQLQPARVTRCHDADQIRLAPERHPIASVSLQIGDGAVLYLACFAIRLA
jgi:hypothetical protein